MKIKITAIMALLVLTGVFLALAEDDTGSQNPVVSTSQENNDSSAQWVWGEVTAVDAQNKALTLKYLDYEADQEKEISLIADETTNYENVKSLDEIQPKDNLSVDYVSKDGNNIAKSISLEKAESAPSGAKTEAAGAKKPEAAVQANQ